MNKLNRFGYVYDLNNELCVLKIYYDNSMTTIMHEQTSFKAMCLTHFNEISLEPSKIVVTDKIPNKKVFQLL